MTSATSSDSGLLNAIENYQVTVPVMADGYGNTNDELQHLISMALPSSDRTDFDPFERTATS